MAEIGVQCLAAGDREEHRSQRDQSDRPVREQELDSIIGIDRGKNGGIVSDVHDPHHSQAGEPQHHHRTEGGRHPGRALALDREQHHQDEHGERHDIMLERRRGELEAFDGR